MLQFPGSWIVHYGANIATAYPPDLGARMRYYERLTPQPSFAAIVNRLLGNDPLFQPQFFGDMTRIVTAEGEYGAWISIDGTREGSRAMKFVGALFLDEFATALDGIALIPQHFAEVQTAFVQLLRTAEHHFTERQRRFFYVPPAGWHGLASGMIANWYPLDFPNNLTNIVVPPAMRVESSGTRELEYVIAQCEAGMTIEASTRDDLVSAGGISGTCLRVLGTQGSRAERLHRELVVFITGGHLYRFRLETGNAARLLELRELFLSVARSFRPLPTADERRTGIPFASPSSAFEHWVS